MNSSGYYNAYVEMAHLTHDLEEQLHTAMQGLSNAQAEITRLRADIERKDAALHKVYKVIGPPEDQTQDDSGYYELSIELRDALAEQKVA